MVQVIKVDPQNWEQYMQLRHHVFCVERDVPEEIQVDEYDTLAGCAEHFMAQENGKALGVFRCRPEGEKIHLQRFCVLKDYRSHGVGRRMLEFARDYYREKEYRKIVMEAKFSAKPFYEACGCITTSDVFVVVELPHVKMELPLVENS